MLKLRVRSSRTLLLAARPKFGCAALKLWLLYSVSGAVFALAGVSARPFAQDVEECV